MDRDRDNRTLIPRPRRRWYRATGHEVLMWTAFWSVLGFLVGRAIG